MHTYHGPTAIARFVVSLFCKGIRIDASCNMEKQRFLDRRRAGLGSGLELIVPGDKKAFWVNAPVEEKFVSRSPYLLLRDEKGHRITQEGGKSRKVVLPQAPSWYHQKTSRGILMSRVAILQGTTLGIYVGEICSFWEMGVPCKFCATGLNVGKHEESCKEVQDVVETALAAKKESGVTLVHFNSGYQKGKDLSLVLEYVKAIKREVGLLVGVQCIPSEDLTQYDALIRAGVDHFSFCYEFHDPAFFERYLPGKSQHIGQKRFFRAMEYVAGKMPRGTVSGEIIAGVEPVDSTKQAIEYITGLGAFPTVCIFRPLLGTPMEEYPSPGEEEMTQLFQQVALSCLKKKIPIGMAPNLEVSIIMTPDDCRYLLPRNFSWYLSHYKLKGMKKIAAPYFYFRMRKRRDPKNS